MRNFVSSDEKSSRRSQRAEYLEMPYNSFFEVLGILKPFFKEGFKPPEARSFFRAPLKIPRAENRRNLFRDILQNSFA